MGPQNRLTATPKLTYTSSNYMALTVQLSSVLQFSESEQQKQTAFARQKESPDSEQAGW